MTVRDILRYNDVMKSMIDNTSLDTTVKFRFLNMCKQFEPVVENFKQVRDEVLRKYAETKDDGSYGIFTPERDGFGSDEEYDAAIKAFNEKVKSFEVDLEPIESEDVKIEFTKFKANEIMNAGLPADVLLVLYELIEP